jgi:uncharacterized heparinase superfamily protein
VNLLFQLTSNRLVSGDSTRRLRSASALRRIGRMPPAEIAYRGRQEVSKLLDRRSHDASVVDPDVCLRLCAPELASPDARRDLIQKRLPSRFFEGASDSDTARRIAGFPAAYADVVATADQLIGKRFDLLGYRHLWFGDPIDWQLDPVARRQAPREHWSRLDPLDHSRVGDSKVIWELNRHQWLVRLSQAWLVTGDDSYARSCVDAIDEWHDANPRGTGINWSSSLELAYRLISWCWVLVLLRNASAVTDQWLTRVLASIRDHANHVARHLSLYSSPNTHVTGEALGLFYAGVLFPEFRDAARWRRLGARVLTAECAKQIPSDGVHFEQSTCYQAYTVDIYTHFVLLAQRNRLQVPAGILDRLQQMVEFLMAVRRPDGTIPAIGDADGGTLLPLATRAAHDGRGRFGIAAALFGRKDFAWASGKAPPELLWLMGPAAAERHAALGAVAPLDNPSRLFPAGGYAVMRSGWERDAHQLIVDVGPLGCPTTSGHGHADLLSLQCAIFGEPCLVDPGTYCYTSEPSWRDFFRSTGAHSAVEVDGLSQAAPAGPFAWHQRPKAHLRSWLTEPDLDVLDATHDAYRHLSVTCRRRVIFVKPQYWLVVDDLEGSGTHEVNVTFQFAPTVRVRVLPHGWAKADMSNGRGLWVLCLASGPLHPSISCGDISPTRGWVSSDYGQRAPAPALVYSGAVALPWRSITLLLPEASGAAVPPTVSPIFDDHGCPLGITLNPPYRSARLDGGGVVILR